MINIFLKTAPEIDKELAERLAGKRFEQTGDISLASLTKLAIALGIEDELEKLFTEVPFNSIQEVINAQTK